MTGSRSAGVQLTDPIASSDTAKSERLHCIGGEPSPSTAAALYLYELFSGADVLMTVIGLDSDIVSKASFESVSRNAQAWAIRRLGDVHSGSASIRSIR